MRNDFPGTHNQWLITQVQASRALALLTDQERASVLRYHFVRDAKMALGSALLKRHVISSLCDIHWSLAQFTRDAHTKPVFRLADDSEPLLFNVSHQAGLVALFAVHRPTPGLSIGVDVACPSERRTRDHEYIKKDGWPRYVDMHESVLSPSEVRRLKQLPFHDMDRKLAYFYTLWCFREAYVKMTGEALMAKWLAQLEFRYFAPPGETPPEGGDLEIWFQGEQLKDVDVRMEWFSNDYTVCTAVKAASENMRTEGPWILLDVDQVLESAETSNA